MISSIMANHSDLLCSLSKFVFMTVLVTFIMAEEICDKSKCPGPLAYYKGLDCKPVYKNTSDCCPTSFDCSHLKNLSKNKCYANGHAYSIGEALRDEDRNPCDIFCVCGEGYSKDSMARFSCGSVKCPYMRSNENCFYKKTADSCCSLSRVCLKEGEQRATCKVGGRVYEEGELFQPNSATDIDCICMPGYKGENVEPFCKKLNRSTCSPLFNNPDAVQHNCMPVFDDRENLQTDCNFVYTCQNNDDSVIHNHDAEVVETDGSKTCQFGNLTMHIGDKLEEGTLFRSYCVRCVCEVPPMLTCTKRNDGECAFTFLGDINQRPF